MALSLLALTATAQNFTVTGKGAASFEGKTLYLYDLNSMAVADSCAVAGGEFNFDGTVDGQAAFMITTGRRSRTQVPVMAQPGTKAVVDLSAAAPAAADNGGLNDKLAAIEGNVKSAGDIVNGKIEQLQKEGKSRKEIYELLQGDVEAIYDIYRNGIQDNKDNIVGGYIVSVVASQFYTTLEELDAVINDVKYANSFSSVRQMRDGMLKAEATKAGKMFTDFTGFALDGKPSKLSDYVGKGKYVLVDFWASWCGPCKAEIPNLIELQNKFGGDKFTVLGVNVWDQEEKFKAALESEGIAYPQIYIPQDNKDNATELYGIRGIPQIILFAPDGTIVQRDLRGDAMKALVEEKLK